MSRPLAITFAASVVFHAGLVVFLGWLSLWPQRETATLGETGGVIWFNLNPGGAGLGGEGGRGAPSGEALGGSEAKSPAIEKKATATKEATEAKKKPKAPTLPAEKNNALERPPSEKPADIPGPGEGDAAGAKTGPGGGGGQGLGEGQGGGSGAGQDPGGAGPLSSGGSGKGGDSDAILAKIRAKITRAKRYPRQARSEGLEGVCGISFAIKPDGSLAFVELSKSSGYAVLDEEALATVRRAAPFPYYAGPIRFSLRFSLKDL